ncbi:MAG: AAA family ATPase [Imperialibacter sp.]|uniref:AAA family ATPase n=1 Tax=Imperialibacter sp. TaxID=2038411 RepID=UPI0032EAF188
MIKQLAIKNFKSIKSLEIPCKKLNVFIGEPNSGKSNILEALSLKSQSSFGRYLSKDIFRYKTIGDLFYDFDINTPIEVNTDNDNALLFYAIRENKIPENQFHFIMGDQQKAANPIRIAHDGEVVASGDIHNTKVKFYEFKRLQAFAPGYMPHLSVPFGDNLPGLLLTNSNLKKWVSDFFKSKDLTLTLKPTENDLTISKFVEGEIYSYPYFSISETLQRIVFYSMAIKSNENSTLLLDEPESNTFPFYTKILGESIALDESNQFFITTHNPYLLLSLIEKSKSADLNVCLVQMKDFKTVVTVLDEKQLSKVLDFESDVFFNFDKIVQK